MSWQGGMPCPLYVGQLKIFTSKIRNFKLNKIPQFGEFYYKIKSLSIDSLQPVAICSCSLSLVSAPYTFF